MSAAMVPGPGEWKSGGRGVAFKAEGMQEVGPGCPLLLSCGGGQGLGLAAAEGSDT